MDVNFKLLANRTDIVKTVEQANFIKLWLGETEPATALTLHSDDFGIEFCKEMVRAAARIHSGAFKVLEPGQHLYKEGDTDGFGLFKGLVHVKNTAGYEFTLKDYPLGWAEILEFNEVERLTQLRDLRDYQARLNDEYWGRLSAGTPNDRANVHDGIDSLVKGKALLVWIAPFRGYVDAIIARNFTVNVEKADANYAETVSQKRAYVRDIAPIQREVNETRKNTTANNLPTDDAKDTTAVVMNVCDNKGKLLKGQVDLMKVTERTSLQVCTPAPGGNYRRAYRAPWSLRVMDSFVRYAAQGYAIEMSTDIKDAVA